MTTIAETCGAERTRVKRRRLLCMALLIAALAYLSGSLEVLERGMTDLEFSVLKRPPSADIVFVAIDTESLRDIGVWPWPRSLHARVIDRLVAAGARRIAFDIDFSSPSTEAADAAFERALAAAEGRVVLAAHKQLQRSAGTAELAYTAPLPRFARHAAIAGTSIRPAADGLVRELTIRNQWHDRVIPSLPADLAGAVVAPFDSFAVDYGIDPYAIPYLSYGDVVAGRFDPDAIRDKTILVGAAAVELGDQLPVPVYKSLSGALLIALGSESLRQDRALHRLGPIPIVVVTGLLVAALGPSLIAWPWRRSLGAGVLALAAIEALGVLAQWHWPVLIDTAPAIAVVLLLVLCSLVRDIDRLSGSLFTQGRQLHRTNSLMRSIVEHGFDGILVVRPDGRVDFANSAAQTLFGAQEGALRGWPVAALIPDLADPAGHGSGTIEIGSGRRELQAVRMDGTGFPAEVATGRIVKSDDRLFVAVVHDISARQAQQRKLEHQALHDALTGLANRTLIMDRLERALERARQGKKPLALLLLDLDRFKEINDTLGHQAGDGLLREVARRLPAALRDGDSIGRLGGDEFALVLPAVTDLGKATAVATRTIESLKPPFEHEGLSLEMGASIGIALYPDHAEDAARLLRCADVAMYAAKTDHVPIAVYDQEKDENSLRNLSLTGELRTAIRDKTLFLAFQPKIDLRTRRVCGVEALARWIHPVHGFIPPDQFIARAEHTGLIQPLTAWALEAAMAGLTDLRRRIPELTMAVNISTRSLQDRSLPNEVMALIATWRIDPADITLEITESALMDNPERALDTLHRLHNIGVRVSIDDFGTGYSSLAYLKSLPVGELKIDRCFVAHMHERERDAQIVRSTINLAHDLGLKVVAEGIETSAQLAALETYGCDIGQGYLFSKPLPGPDWLTWAETSPWAVEDDGPAGSAESAA